MTNDACTLCFIRSVVLILLMDLEMIKVKVLYVVVFACQHFTGLDMCDLCQANSRYGWRSMTIKLATII